MVNKASVTRILRNVVIGLSLTAYYSHTAVPVKRKSESHGLLSSPKKSKSDETDQAATIVVPPEESPDHPTARASSSSTSHPAPKISDDMVIGHVLGYKTCAQRIHATINTFGSVGATPAGFLVDEGHADIVVNAMKVSYGDPPSENFVLDYVYSYSQPSQLDMSRHPNWWRIPKFEIFLDLSDTTPHLPAASVGNTFEGAFLSWAKDGYETRNAAQANPLFYSFFPADYTVSKYIMKFKEQTVDTSTAPAFIWHLRRQNAKDGTFYQCRPFLAEIFEGNGIRFGATVTLAGRANSKLKIQQIGVTSKIEPHDGPNILRKIQAETEMVDGGHNQDACDRQLYEYGKA
ncbi:hypothetical protein FOL47_008738, partial [Perkinsus chesapeaki]